MNRVLIVGVAGLLLALGSHQIRRETDAQEAALQAMLSKNCPMVWENMDRVRALPPDVSSMAMKYCPQI